MDMSRRHKNQGRGPKRPFGPRDDPPSLSPRRPPSPVTREPLPPQAGSRPNGRPQANGRPEFGESRTAVENPKMNAGQDSPGRSAATDGSNNKASGRNGSNGNDVAPGILGYQEGPDLPIAAAMGADSSDRATKNSVIPTRETGQTKMYDSSIESQ